MGTRGLTAKQVEHMKPEEKRVEVAAGGGLFLVVHPTGRKTWMVRYRFRGRTRGLTLAKPYPELSLKQAHAEAEAARDSLANDIDPAIEQAEEQRKDQPESIAAVAEEWLTRSVSETRTYTEVARITHKEIVAAWKYRMVSEIGRADVLKLLDSIVDRGAPIVANRTRSILLRLFGWCLERGYVEASPIAHVKRPARENSRHHFLSEDELRHVWTAAESLAYPFGPYIRLLILTAQRRGEVAEMRWQDVDLAKALWTLPAEQTKPGRVHDVPLSKQAVALLNSLPRFKGDYVFSTTGGKRPISGFSKMRTALDTSIRGIDADTDIADWRLHDLRRTAASWMAANKIPPVVVGALLNHSPGKLMGVTSIYARYAYLPERTDALSLWADYVTGLAKHGAYNVIAPGKRANSTAKAG